MKCTKTGMWALRKDARARLLQMWQSGNYVLRGTHWCTEHRAYHLTRKVNNGNNWAYRD